MPTLTITAKGQLTLRREVLDHLGLRPGDKVAVEMGPGRTVTLDPAPAEPGLDLFIGSLAGRSPRRASLEDIAQAASDGWAGGRA
ncbi:MAG: AbrB/MazE/SpoVT family DNA-binding domain-containing protein [Bifidobacteriaceae bacterium]|jgi:bifunctional DNA-binding transcriptional regulator/antitoxin component of YhaV-PrlF toxin-antitoxin module|nr:AbrB/MazE/SpoVT family DNA-binding domain-containing protein [Bifidobacteriaceae bacterium]